MKSSMPLSYSLKTHLSSQYWFPAAIWALFAIINALFTGQSEQANTAGYFLGMALPLIGGILSAYVLMGDPILELQFSTPRSALRTLLERMGTVLIILAIAALTYQGYAALLHIDMSQYGSFWNLQAAWLVPCLTMITLGSLMALVFCQAMGGALMVGLIWLGEVILHGAMADDKIARYFFIMTGILYPKASALAGNMAVLIALSLVFFILSVILLKKQERYI